MTRLPLDLPTLTGRWQFELSDAVRQHHRQRLAQEISDPVSLAQALSEVEREAASSYFDVSPAGVLTSYVDGTPYFSATLALGAAPLDSLSVPKPTGAVTLHLVDRDSLIMTDPARGELPFRRAQ
jgi:hypothetical protein